MLGRKKRREETQQFVRAMRQSELLLARAMTQSLTGIYREAALAKIEVAEHALDLATTCGKRYPLPKEEKA